jgi:hypothetical protein
MLMYSACYLFGTSSLIDNIMRVTEVSLRSPTRRVLDEHFLLGKKYVVNKLFKAFKKRLSHNQLMGRE